MFLRTDSVAQNHGAPNFHSEVENEFQLSQGDFVGIVQARENKYEFAVRDMRRECPTIHGYGVDFPHAVTFVRQLLDALTE